MGKDNRLPQGGPVPSGEVVFPDQILVKTIDKKHAKWERFAGLWQKYRAMAEGGWRLEEVAEQFVTRRPKEPQDVYRERTKSFTAETPLGNGLTWYEAALFGRSPQVSAHSIDPATNEILGDGDLKPDIETVLKRLKRNVEGTHNGRSFVDFWRKVFYNLGIFGNYWILVDRNPAAADATAAEQADAAFDPYAVGWSPLNVINWSEDAESGDLVEAVIYTSNTETSILDGVMRNVGRWIYYDQHHFAIYRERLDQDSSSRDESKRMAVLERWGEHALSHKARVPLIRIEFQDAEKLWLANRAYLPLRDYIDLDNSVSWALRNSNLAHPIVFTDDDNIQSNLSEHELLQLAPGDRFEWAEPQGRALDKALMRLEMRREEIFRALHLMAQARTSSATASAQSGASKEMDLMPALNILESIGDELIPAMVRLMEWLLDTLEIEGVEVSVRGFQFIKGDPRRIAEIRESVVRADLGSATLLSEVDKAFAEAHLEDPQPAVLAKVLKEIEAAGDPIARLEAKRRQLIDDERRFMEGAPLDA